MMRQQQVEILKSQLATQCATYELLQDLLLRISTDVRRHAIMQQQHVEILKSYIAINVFKSID